MAYPFFPGALLDHFLITIKLIDTIHKHFYLDALSSFSDHFPLKLNFKFTEFLLILSPPIFFYIFEETYWMEFREGVHFRVLGICIPLDRNLDNAEVDANISLFNDINSEITRNTRKKEMKQEIYSTGEYSETITVGRKILRNYFIETVTELRVNTDC